MRSFLALRLLLLFLLIAPPLSAQETLPPPPPGVEVPDLSERLLVLTERFAKLEGRLKAMQAGTATGDIDAGLDNLFLPDSAESFATRYETELSLARDPEVIDDWEKLAWQWLEEGRFDDAETAGFKLWRDAPLDWLRADGLRVMAEAILGRGDARGALELYRASFDVYDDEERYLRLEALEERYDLVLRDIAVDVERPTPSACLVFSQTLRKPLPLEAGDYLEIAPSDDLDISVRGERLCLNGLVHGGRYDVTVRAGLPGTGEAVLHETQQREIVVPDREARVRFKAATYVLPRSGQDRVPLTSVNVERAELTLYRINDRNLAAAVVSGLVESDLDNWAAGEIEENSGTLVWQGQLEIDGERNREASTQVPLTEMLTQRAAGVYALTARPVSRGSSQDWRPRATQWLVVSDLGLTSFEGADGLHALVHSLETAAPLAGVRFKLIARNNALLGESVSDAEGLAAFAPGLLRGSGGDAPALLTAEAGTDSDLDFSFLRLVGPALDLSERGVEGREAPGGLDAFLYPERGVYRPGETVQLSVLLRDPRARAVGGRPLTVSVTRPGGAELFRATATGDELGGYGFEVPLSSASIPGAWTATAFVDSEDDPAGSTTFQVEDFAPQRIEVSLSPQAPAVGPDGDLAVALEGRFLYGPPAAGLASEAVVVLEPAETAFEGYEDWRFGLEQEVFRPQRRSFETPVTDSEGRAVLALPLDPLPDSSLPLAARVEASLFDVGGRPVTQRVSVPLRARQVEIGLKAPGDGSFPEGQPARVEIVALGPDGAPFGERELLWEWVREHHDYTWYRSGEDWQVRTQIVDEVLAAGELVLGGDGRGNLERSLPPGRYRLDVFDVEGSAATSHRVTVGWWAAAELPDVPDALELSVEGDDLAAGETLQAFVKAPFAAASCSPTARPSPRGSTSATPPSSTCRPSARWRSTPTSPT